MSKEFVGRIVRCLIKLRAVRYLLGELRSLIKLRAVRSLLMSLLGEL